jgi:hypothetical protein
MGIKAGEWRIAATVAAAQRSRAQRALLEHEGRRLGEARQQRRRGVEQRLRGRVSPALR